MVDRGGAEIDSINRSTGPSVALSVDAPGSARTLDHRQFTLDVTALYTT